jgi:hypothetical protein
LRHGSIHQLGCGVCDVTFGVPQLIKALGYGQSPALRVPAEQDSLRLFKRIFVRAAQGGMTAVSLARLFRGGP